jgi:hypothetical protein
MTCQACGGKGILKVCYEDGSPTEYALCLCPAAHWFRSDVNADRHTGSYGWQVWAAREQIDPERMYALEDLYSPSELAEMGFAVASQTNSDGGREAALLALSKRRKAKL